MKLVEKAKATGTLAEYMTNIQAEPVVITNRGRPVAALIAIENADLETVHLSTNPKFLDLIERSRARLRSEGGFSSEEMRRRFQSKPTRSSARKR